MANNPGGLGPQGVAATRTRVGTPRGERRSQQGRVRWWRKILDTFNRAAHGSDENDSRDMGYR